MDRRQFLKAGAGAAALLAMRRRAFAWYQSPALAKFGPGQALRTFNNGGLIVAGSDGTRAWPGVTATHYTIRVGQYTDQLHPAPGFGPTTLLGYHQGTGASKKHLSGTVVAQKNTPVQLTLINEMPANHTMPVDKSAFFHSALLYENIVANHLHGGFVPWISDGGPFDWFAPAAVNAFGPSFKNHILGGTDPGGAPIAPRLVTDPKIPGQGEYYYPNKETARLMWYHDHALDLTRLSAYAGVATGYVLRDSYENAWTASGILPSLGTASEIPLIFQDKIFVGPDLATKDPTWPASCPSTVGSLWYPHVYESDLVPPHDRFERGVDSPFAASLSPLPDPSVIPEMFGDTMLVNGTVYPYFEVQRKRYRFRILNACNARFMNLQLYIRDASADGITLAPKGAELDPNGNPVLAPTNAPGPVMVQIGTECGFLPAPVVLNNPPKPLGWSTATGNVNRGTLIMAPAERADVIIDFSTVPAGTNLILYSDTPSPYPGGDPRNDYYVGMADYSAVGGSAPPAPGFGPNTRTIMEFRVGATTPVQTPFATWLTQIRTALGSRLAELQAPPIAGATRRVLALDENFDLNGRLVQHIGTDVAIHTSPGGGTPFPYYGRELTDACTEKVTAGAVEIWEIYNLTGDTHPIHFHLVNVQIINRQPFVAGSFPAPVFAGPARGPDMNERGWKETVRMNPGEVTRVIMRFDLPTVPFTLPTSDRDTLGIPGAGLPGGPPAGQIYHEYVYHCHILEHEEHDMMRPLVVEGPA